MADGSIRIDTKLETNAAKADLKKFEKECEKTAEKIGEVGKTAQAVFTGMSKGQLNNAFSKANKELAKTEEALAAVEAKIAEIQAETDKMLPQAATDEQAANLLAMEEYETAPLVAQRDELTAKAEEYRRVMEAITAEINEQTTAEEAQKALDSAASEGVADADFLGKIKSEQEYNALLDQTRAKMEIIEQQAADIAQKTGIPVQQLLQQNSQYQSLSHRLKLLQANQGKFKGKVSESTAAMRSLEKSVNKVGKSLKTSLNHGIRRLGRLALGVLGVEGVFTVLRRATTAYMEGNEQLSNQMSSLWNVLGYAIGPVIEKLVNWLTIAISYINAFVKALWGVDFVAKANAAALKKQEKATNAAAKAAQQAGFDEMNKLSDTSSSGADAGSTTGQFQTVPIDESKLKGFIENLDTIKGLVLAIAAGFAAWKISAALGATLGTCAAAALGVAGAVLAVWEFIQMLDGIEWEELGLYVVGIAAAATGLGLALNGVAAAIAIVLGAIGLIIVGFKDWLENGKSLEALAAIAIGVIALGGSIAGLGMPIAAVGVAIIGLIMYWDEVRAWVEKNIYEPLSWFFDPLIEAGKAAWTWLDENLFTPIKDWIEGFKAWVEKYITKPLTEAFEAIKTNFLLVYDKVKEIFDKIKEIVVALAGAFKTYIWDPFTKWLGGIWSKFYAAIKPIIDWAKGVMNWINKNIIEPLKKALNILVNAIGAGIEGAIKGVVNGMFSTIEKRINGFIKLLNAAIDIINKIPGVNITKVELLSLPRLAKGGIVNNPGRGVPVIAGEAGSEAILPLDNHTEWMDALADKINGGAAKIVVPIYLNGRKIAEEIIDLNNRRQFATNGAI